MVDAGRNDSVDYTRIRRGDGHSDLSFFGCRPTVRQQCPVIAAIRGFVLTAARTAAVDSPRRSQHLPGGCIDDLRIRWIHRHIDGTGFFVYVKDLLPRLPAIFRTEESALGVGAVGMT